jgi:hypothetical protein
MRRIPDWEYGEATTGGGPDWPFRFLFRLLGHGWASCIVRDPFQTLRMDLSNFPGRDYLWDLSKSIIALTRGSEVEQLIFRGEPGEYFLTLERAADLVRIRVEFKAGGKAFEPRPAFDCETGLRHLAAQVVRQLTRILEVYGLEGYEDAWDAEAVEDYEGFPLKELKELEAFLGPPVAHLAAVRQDRENRRDS